MFDTCIATARAAGHNVGSDHLAVSHHTYVAPTESQALDEGEAAFSRFVELLTRGALFDDMNNLPTGYEAYKTFLAPVYITTKRRTSLTSIVEVYCGAVSQTTALPSFSFSELIRVQCIL